MLVVAVVAANLTFGQSALVSAIDRGGTWLAEAEANDGAWGKREEAAAAGFAVNGLRAGLEEVGDDLAVLSSQSPGSAADAALQLLATRDSGLLGSLQSWRNPDGSYSTSEAGLVTTTGLAVLAQALVGVTDTLAINYLGSQQLDDGSWGSGGTANDTGLVVYALAAAGINDQVMTDALGWLLRNQSPRGDWGTPEGTAWALLGLTTDANHPGVAEGAAAFLLDLQNSDGGFARYEGGSSEVVTSGLVCWALHEAGAEFPGWESAAGYLKAQRNGAAGWWRVAPAVIDTTTVLDTFALLNRSDSTTALAVLWILQRETPNTDFLARRLGSLARFGNSSATDLASLLALQRDDGGWGTGERFAANPLDTAIVLDGLYGAGFFDTAVLQQATQYLVTTQRADGSWGLTSNDENGTIWATALAMEALKKSRKVFDLENTINAGTSYLESRQLGDGSWVEEGPGMVWESALAFIACMKTDFSTAAAQAGLQFILDSQEGDGSWNSDPFDTALAMRALVESQPNLRIGDHDIGFSAPGGIDGDEITISAVVHNSGGFAVSNAVVRFYLGDPHTGGVAIGPDQDIASLGPGTSVPVNQFWDTTGLGGDKNIFVLVDPDDTIEEGNESDNKAVNRFRVSTKADLVVTAMTCLPENPQIGEELTITVLVSNIGETAATGAMLALYRGDPGDPANTPSVLGPSTIPAGLSQPYTITTSEGPGVVTFTAIADPDGTVAESNEGNNQATVTVEVGERVDLLVNSVSFSRRDPAEGDMLEIWAEIYNANIDPVSNVVVAFYMDGSPGNVPELARLTLASVGGGQAITTEHVQWDTTGQAGDHAVYVLVDPDNTVVETDELNNSQVGRFMVNALPDLIMGDDVLTFHVDSSSNPPQTTVPRGTPVIIRAPLSNAGAQDAENVVFRLFRGSPQAGGVQIGEDLVADRIPYKSGPMSGTEPTDQPWLTKVMLANLETSDLEPGEYTIFGWIDPDNVVVESNISNNLGSSLLIIGDQADLAGKAGTFAISDALPEEGDTVTISGIIENRSATPVSEFAIRVFDGNPLAEGVVVYERSYSDNGGPALAGNGEVGFDFTWNSDLGLGSHIFYLLIDPDDEVLETSEDNNQETLDCEVVPPATPDFTLTRDDLSFDPEQVASGETVSVTARLRNLRRLAVDNVAVRFLYVDQTQGEVAIGSDQVVAHIEPLGFGLATVSLDTSVLSGSVLILVKADPDDLIAERDETNNLATTVLHLYLGDGSRVTDLAATVDLTDVYLNWSDPADPAITGYDVARDQALINPEWDELARQSLVEASSFTVQTQASPFADITNQAAAAADGNPMTYWQSRGSGGDEWLALTLPVKVLLKAVTVDWGGAPADYQLQTFNGFEWVTVLAVTGNQDDTTYHVFETAIASDRLRVLIPEPTAGPQSNSISEIRVHSLRPVQ